MKTIIYMVRHANKEKDLVNGIDSLETKQISDEKCILSVIGEERAKKFGNLKELENVEYIYASNYIRTISTAKYIAKKNRIKVNVDARLGKTKEGIEYNETLPEDYSINQWLDFDYKIGHGESIKDTSIRMYQCFKDILNKNKGKEILIVAHGTSIASLFTELIDVKIDKKTKERRIYFNNRLLLKGKIEFTRLFKLELEDDILMDIKIIKF